MEYIGRESSAAVLYSIVFIALIFVIIVLHELGHALAARRYGIETQDITLLPIGGLARLKRIPEDPAQELVVAFAGPLVNLVLAAALFVGISISAGPREVIRAGYMGGDLIAQLFWVNVILAVFNLIPAFPMDGGRVFRALLAFRMNRVRATEIAVGVGHFCALAFGAVGLFRDPFLVFIAFFIWIGADAELQHVRLHASLSGVTVGDVMKRNFDSVDVSSRLEDVSRLAAPGFQREFPVVEDGRVVGFIGMEDVARGIARAGPQAPVAEAMHREFETAKPGDSLEQVISDLRPDASQVIAVMEDGKLAGIVTPSNIGEHIMVRSALARTARRA